MLTVFFVFAVPLVTVAVIWGLVFLIEFLPTVDPHWRIPGPSRRAGRRNCPTCRDHYPVCWLEPCSERDHHVFYDCTGIDGETMLCPKHEARYWHIRDLEKELLL